MHVKCWAKINLMVQAIMNNLILYNHNNPIINSIVINVSELALLNNICFIENPMAFES